MAEEFTLGQTVYDRSGCEYQFDSLIPDGRALVREIYLVDGYDGGERYPADNPTILPAAALSITPPVRAVSQEVAEQVAKLAEVKEQLREAMRDVANQESERTRRLEALKDLPALARIEDFLAGRITHFAVRNSYSTKVEVLDFEAFARGTEDGGRRAQDLKLLTLFGRSNGDIAWKLNQYYDGSGSWIECHPCCSEDEAREKAAEWLQATWEAHRAAPDKVRWLKDAVDSAKKLAIEAPVDILASNRELMVKAASQRVAQLEEELAKARATVEQAATA